MLPWSATALNDCLILFCWLLFRGSNPVNRLISDPSVIMMKSTWPMVPRLKASLKPSLLTVDLQQNYKHRGSFVMYELISAVSTGVGDAHHTARPCSSLAADETNFRNTPQRASVQTSWTDLIERTLTGCWLWSGKWWTCCLSEAAAAILVLRRTRIEQLMTSKAKYHPVRGQQCSI